MRVPSVRRRNQSDSAPTRTVPLAFAQHQFGNSNRGVRSGKSHQIRPPPSPNTAVVIKGPLRPLSHLTVLLGDYADVGLLNQTPITFLLPGNDLVQNHRASRRHGFLYCSAARLGDDQMMA